MLNKIFTRFVELPGPVKLTSIVYVSSLLCYNIWGTYSDSKLVLENYRENKLHELSYLGASVSDIVCIKSEWDAVKFGGSMFFWERMFNSVIWPITTIKNCVPAIVLAMNPPTKK